MDITGITAAGSIVAVSVMGLLFHRFAESDYQPSRRFESPRDFVRAWLPLVGIIVFGLAAGGVVSALLFWLGNSAR